MHIFKKVALTIIAKRKNRFELTRFGSHHWQIWAHKAKRLFACSAIAGKQRWLHFGLSVDILVHLIFCLLKKSCWKSFLKTAGKVEVDFVLYIIFRVVTNQRLF